MDIKQNLKQFLEIVKDNISITRIICCIVIASICYLYHIYRQARLNQLILLDNPSDSLSAKKYISYDRFPISKTSVQCTYSLWLYVNDRPGNAEREHGDNYFYRVFSKEADYNILLNSYNCSKKKTELMKKDVDLNYGSPGLYYRPRDGKLMITAQTSKTHKYYTTPILLQKWNNIVIVIENNFIDLYINNNLYRSYNVGSVINLGNGHLKIANSKDNIYGRMSYFRYFNSALSPEGVNKLYDHTNKMNPKKPWLWWLFP